MQYFCSKSPSSVVGLVWVGELERLGSLRASFHPDGIMVVCFAWSVSCKGSGLGCRLVVGCGNVRGAGSVSFIRLTL